MESTPSYPHVNKKLAKLLVSSSGIAELHVNGLPTRTLEDTPWSRWYLRTHFEHLQADAAGIAWYKKHDPLEPIAIKGLISTPRPYQWLGIRRMIIENCADWLDMGLGKSLISLAFSLYCLEHGLGQHFLILCPPTIFVSWLDEVKKHLDPALNAETYIVHGPKKLKILAELKASKTRSPKFVLTSYETLANIREHLESLPITCIFLDESSKVKNTTAQRTQATHALGIALPKARKFCLSGTPSTKNPLGLYSQYEFLGDGFSGSQSYAIFELKYAVSKLFMMVRLPHGKVTSVDADDPASASYWLQTHYPPKSNVSYAQLGYSFERAPKNAKHIKIMNFHRRNIRFKNLEDLHEVSQRRAYTLYKTDVLKDLPPKTRMKREIELSDEQRKAYREVLDTNRTLIGKIPFSFHDMGSPYAKLHQIANGYIRNTDGSIHFFKSQPKMLELEQILAESGDQKLIVWSPFRPQIAQAVAFLKSADIECVELHGDVPVDKRGDIVHAFQDPAGPRVLVANPAVGGMGLNLTCANLETFLTNWFQPDARIQAEDRCWRIGQSNAVTIVDLVATATLEVEILRKTLAEITLEKQIISMTACMGG
jgi:SNF2 family DNA or RNA helicase